MKIILRNVQKSNFPKARKKDLGRVNHSYEHRQNMKMLKDEFLMYFILIYQVLIDPVNETKPSKGLCGYIDT